MRSSDRGSVLTVDDLPGRRIRSDAEAVAGEGRRNIIHHEGMPDLLGDGAERGLVLLQVVERGVKDVRNALRTGEEQGMAGADELRAMEVGRDERKVAGGFAHCLPCGE